MEIERLKQRIHIREGLPAFKAGEWPGSVSSHWLDLGKRILIPVRRENILLGMEETNHRPTGRKHYLPQISHETTFKPGLKHIKERNHENNRKNETKTVEIKFTEGKVYHPKRHFEERFGYETSPVPFHIVTSEKSNIESTRETSLEEKMGKKKRILSLTQMRNFYDSTSPGDKIYKHPHYTGNFFKDGGLVSGSTNKLRFNKNMGKKSNNFYETINLDMRSLDPSKIWENKMLAEESDFQHSYVKNLEIWNKTILKEFLPKVVEEPKGKTVNSKKVDTKKKK